LETQRHWSIRKVNQVIKEALDASLPYPIPVTGEVSNLTIHSSGHVYLTLKDKTSQISAAWFGHANEARKLGLKNGLQVECWGKISVFHPKGTYQITLSSLELAGKGLIRQEFERLKLKLRDQGLLDQQRKRPIPQIPKTVGVITSPTGAAIQDFLQVVNRRFSGLHIRIYPGRVQGPRTAEFTIAGLKYLNVHNSCDVIVITRGGGSYEDLSGFNDEALAHAIANSRIPVISAIGHEPDVTIPDLVADFTAPTPSAAAELVCGKKSELLQNLRSKKAHLNSLINWRLSETQKHLQRLTLSPILSEPKHILTVYMQKLDEIKTTLAQNVNRLLSDKKHQLALLQSRNIAQQQRAKILEFTQQLNRLKVRQTQAIQGQLERTQQKLNHQKSTIMAYNPKNVISRGYAILRAEDGTIIKKTNQVKVNQAITATVIDGSMDLTLNSITKES